MNLQEIYTYTASIANQEGYKRDILPDDFNSYLHTANMEMFNFYLDLFQINQVIDDALKPFQWILGKDAAKLSVNTAGEATKPTDYEHFVAARYLYDVNTQVMVEEIKESDLTNRLNDALKFKKNPYRYPVMVLRSSVIQFYPKDVGFIEFAYLRTPVTPRYAYLYDSDSDSNKYFPGGSVQLEWDDKYHMKFLKFLLKEIGIQLTDDRIAQYAVQSASNTRI